MKNESTAIESAQQHLADLLKTQLERVERMKSAPDWLDFKNLRPLRIGIIGGDGNRSIHLP